MHKFLDDVKYEDKLYEEISNVVESVLGDNVSEKQKLQLFNFLLCRAQEESEQYNNYFNDECYNNTYPISNQQPCFNLYIPLSQPPFHCYFQPQQQPIYSFQPSINPNANPNPFQFPSSPYNYYPQGLTSAPKQEKDKSKKSHKKHKKDKKHKKAKNKKSSNPKITSVKPYCTYTISGRKYIKQVVYKCRTCGITGNEGVCQYCAIHCHKGHDIYYDGVHTRFFCDCQDHGGCQLTEHPGDNLDCTFKLSKGTKIPQPMYQCEDCDIEFDNCICQNCALKLHKNHQLTLVDGDNLDKVCYHYKQSHHL